MRATESKPTHESDCSHASRGPVDRQSPARQRTRHPVRLHTLGALTVAALCLTACGGGSDNGSTTMSEQKPTTPAVATELKDVQDKAHKVGYDCFQTDDPFLNKDGLSCASPTDAVNKPQFTVFSKKDYGKPDEVANKVLDAITSNSAQGGPETSSREQMSWFYRPVKGKDVTGYCVFPGGVTNEQNPCETALKDVDLEVSLLPGAISPEQAAKPPEYQGWGGYQQAREQLGKIGVQCSDRRGLQGRPSAVAGECEFGNTLAFGVTPKELAQDGFFKDSQGKDVRGIHWNTVSDGGWVMICSNLHPEDCDKTAGFTGRPQEPFDPNTPE